MLPDIDRLVMIISQARDEKRPAIEGLVALGALTKSLAAHQLLLIIGAERAGATDKTIGEALDMTAAEVDTWRLEQLHLTNDETSQ